MKLSEDKQDNRWGLLSADLKELEQQIATFNLTVPHTKDLYRLEQKLDSHRVMIGAVVRRVCYLEQVCEQCILEHKGREK